MWKKKYQQQQHKIKHDRLVLEFNLINQYVFVFQVNISESMHCHVHKSISKQDLLYFSTQSMCFDDRFLFLLYFHFHMIANS